MVTNLCCMGPVVVPHNTGKFVVEEAAHFTVARKQGEGSQGPNNLTSTRPIS